AGGRRHRLGAAAHLRSDQCHRLKAMRRSPHFPHHARGMSLLEVILVIVLIGGILALVASRLVGGQHRANVRLAESQLITLARAAPALIRRAGEAAPSRMDAGRRPEWGGRLGSASGGQGWLGPYAKAEGLKDRWGKPIQYRGPGASGRCELVSLGADGQAGGE